MNTETGQVYRGADEIDAAKERGEPVVEVSETVAKALDYGLPIVNRAERRRRRKAAGGFATRFRLKGVR